MGVCSAIKSPLIISSYRVILLAVDGRRIRCGVRAGRSAADNLLDVMKTVNIISGMSSRTQKKSWIDFIHVLPVVTGRCAVGLADSGRRFIRDVVQMGNGRGVSVAVETFIALSGDLDENYRVTASRIVFGPQGHVTDVIYVNHVTCTETSQLAVYLILS